MGGMGRRTMIDCWQRLDLAPTTDERAIRRAYAKILKTIDQDIEPERFITLREAMQQALDQARYADWDEPDDEDWAATTVNEVESNEQSKTDAEPLIIHVAQGHSVDSAPEIAEPIESPADFASAWTTEHTVERQKIHLNPSSSAVPIWQDWQPNQTERRVLERDVALLREAWWAGQYDDARYIALADILKRLVDQPLALQMDIQEQLVELLAWSPEHAETERFIQLLVEKLGLQRDAVGLDAPSMQLQQRWMVLESRTSFWRSMPEAYRTDLEHLADGSRFYWCSMWRLSGAKDPRILGLKNINWHGVPYRDPDRLGNLALQLLLRVRPSLNYQKAFLLVYGVNILFLIYFYEISTLVIFGLSVAFGWLWHILSLAPLSAWIAVKSQVTPIYRAALFGLWLLLGMLLLLTSPLLPAPVLMVAVWSWGILTSLWMAEADFYSPTPSLLRCLWAEPNIKADRWMIGLLTVVMVIAIGGMLVTFFARFLGAELSLAITESFTLLFFMLVWFRSYVLDQLKVLQSSGGHLLDRWIAYTKTITDLLGFFGVLLVWCLPIALLLLLFNLPLADNPALMGGVYALFCVASLTLVMLIPRSEMLSYIMRHLSYLVGLVSVYALWIKTGETTNIIMIGLFAIPAGLLGWYWYHSAAVDTPSA